jgi:hypothetical protein
MNRLAKALFSLIAVLLCGSCVTVHPWERAILSDPAMQGELIPEAVFLEQHFLGTREASAGGYAIAGGGCGCN